MRPADQRVSHWGAPLGAAAALALAACTHPPMLPFSTDMPPLVLVPGAKLETVYSIGVRLIFDWRRYF